MKKNLLSVSNKKLNKALLIPIQKKNLRAKILFLIPILNLEICSVPSKYFR